MVFWPRVLLVFCMVCLSAGQAGAAEVLLKIVCTDADPAVGDMELPAGSSPCMPVEMRTAPLALQALYPDQGRIIGRQLPGESGCQYKFIIDFTDTAHVFFIEFGVDAAVLGSLASAAGIAGLQDLTIEQYTHGSAPDDGVVFTAGYSLFMQELMQMNAREWLERVMPLKNGIGIIALRRTGAETRTDTLLIRVDQPSLPRGASGMSESIISVGWEQ
jgi:hypothetical protein